MKKNKAVVLVDGNSFLYRMFYTKPPRIHQGQRIESAIAMLRGVESIRSEQALKGFDEIQTIVVNDAPGKSWRHEFYSDYKHLRKGMPEELKCQEDLAHKLLAASGIPTIEQTGLEADDLIGILARYFEKEECQVLIWGNDKDLYQLITEDVKLYNPDSRKIIDANGVIEKFGVPPHLIQDLLALMGDDKDCIPGIDACGIKTAAKWINIYGGLQSVIENADQIKGLASDNLRRQKELLPSNLILTTIVTDFSRIDPSIIESINNPKIDHSELKKLLAKCGISYSEPMQKSNSKQKESEPEKASSEKSYNYFDQGMLF